MQPSSARLSTGGQLSKAFEEHAGPTRDSRASVSIPLAGQTSLGLAHR